MVGRMVGEPWALTEGVAFAQPEEEGAAGSFRGYRRFALRHDVAARDHDRVGLGGGDQYRRREPGGDTAAQVERHEDDGRRDQDERAATDEEPARRGARPRPAPPRGPDP